MKKLGLLTLILAACAFAALGQSADEFLKKCDAAYGKANYSDAVKQCTKAIEKRPGFQEALMARAFAYEKLGNIDAALGDHTELIRLTGAAQFYFYRAGIYLDRGRKDEAVADLTAAIQEEPAGRYTARCHYQRGLIYEERGKTAEAQADFKRTVQLSPDNKEAAKRIKPEPTNVLLDGGPLSTAADRMVENIFVTTKPAAQQTPASTGTIPPAEPNSVSKPATITNNAPNVTAKPAPPAKPEYQSSRELDGLVHKLIISDDAKAEFGAAAIKRAIEYLDGRTRYEQTRFTGDKEHAKKIADIYENIASLEGDVKNPAGEVAAYTFAIKYNPDNIYYYEWRALSYSDLGLYKQAVEDMNEVIRRSPNQYRYHASRGSYYAMGGKHAEAVKDYDIAISVVSDLWEAYAARAHSHCRLGNKAKAKADEAKATQLGGTIAVPCK